MAKKEPSNRSAYRHFSRIDTRWMDNDIYGHVNNVTYYSYFDTAVNRYLIEHGGLDIQSGNIVGFVVNSGCDYYGPIAFPDRLEAGLRVSRLGNSSVEYRVGIFRDGENTACAEGHFVHVFVERNSNSPVPIPETIRTALIHIQTDN